MHLTRDEEGATLAISAFAIGLFLLVCVLVVDVGNWFQHKRHLQLQADAAALAAAGDVRFPCSDAPIIARAHDYATRNQHPGIPTSRTHVLVNSQTFYGQTEDDPDLPTGGPCASKTIDVKITETDLPWFFGLGMIDFVNAQARVGLRQVGQIGGLPPTGVPDVDPKRVHATFIDEDTGAALASVELSRNGTSNGLSLWDNSTAPLALPVTAQRISVRVAMSGRTDTVNCADFRVECFDDASNNGMLFIRGWSIDPLASNPNRPVLHGVNLVAGTCSDPYFVNLASGSCTFGVTARAAFTGGVTASGARLTAVVNGTNYTMTYNSTTQLWSSPTTIPLPAVIGPRTITIDWAHTAGSLEGQSCNTTGNNPCKGSFGVVHRAWSASETRSGPIKAMTLSENGVSWANSFQRCSASYTSCTRNVVLRVGLTGTLADAVSVNDQLVSLRVVGGSQNQSLDCDPDLSNFTDEMAQGCSPQYTRNKGEPCPSNLWASPQPWSCVKNATGTARNQVTAGLNKRVLGSEKPSVCNNPNKWANFPNFDPNDPRLVPMIITEYGAFSGSGSATIPVQNFGTFYVTGWASQGGGFTNPCQGAGDDPVSEGGVIVGHWVKYLQGVGRGGGGGEEVCEFNVLGPCVPVMTK